MIATIGGRRARAAPSRARAAGERDRLVERERARRAGHEVQPDRVRAGAIAAWTPASSVMPQIFTNGARAASTGSRGGAPGRDEGARRRLRIAGADERLADERGVEAERAPAADRRGVADAGFGDDEAVLGDELAQPRRPARGRPSSVRRSRLLMPMTRAPRRERRLDLALVVRLDERLEAEVERAVHERRRGRRGCSTASSRTASAPAARRTSSWRGSTTNSFASTGTRHARRGPSVRSSTDPPNQCGSHSTEIAAAPPAW